MAKVSADPLEPSAGQIPFLPDFGDALQIVGATPPSSDTGLVIFAVIRDEMFFLPAFLAHHRQLGVRQFLFLDDRSSDGSAQYIASQPDCTLLHSPLSYADRVRSFDLAGRVMERRACFFFKQYIPEIWLKGRTVLALDADEFLLLPPKFTDADAFVSALERHQVVSVAASLLEFYPRHLADLEQACCLEDFTGLINHAPYYDHTPLVRFRLRGGMAGIRPSASTRIFRAAGIAAPYTTTPFKVPLYRHQRNWIVGSHRTRKAPDRRILLTLAHFKFTHDLYRRTRMAIELQSHSQASRKYQCYAELFELGRCGDLALIDSSTRRFDGTGVLQEVGLMRYGLD